MTTPLIRAKDVQISFGGVIAADNVCLDVLDREKLAIIGPNGAGKTTFLNICTGYIKPTRGSVYFQEKEITGMPPRMITRLGIARTFQIPQLFLEHTVMENMLLALSAHHRKFTTFTPMADIPEREEAAHILKLVRISEDANRLASILPEGVRKLLDIAMGLALKPSALLMDEPTSGVSSQEKFEIMDILVEALNERQVTSVFVEHDMEVVSRYADRVAVWDAGQIRMVGTPLEVLNHPDVIDRVIGIGGSHAAL